MRCTTEPQPTPKKANSLLTIDQPRILFRIYYCKAFFSFAFNKHIDPQSGLSSSVDKSCLHIEDYINSMWESRVLQAAQGLVTIFREVLDKF